MVFSDRAQSDVRRLDRATARRVIGKLRWLAENFEATKLTALTGPKQGQFRLRVGDYRVVYVVDRKKREIEVYRVRHRREVYRD
ncbi:type II toxin-antitoxin system RelE/ParE family toxin [Candidatus Poribacteria bacterium]|nr:type II toxin-antitoxin system RelE/ParE family toxin [Candidatus Poribacteria bacterium]